MIIANTANVYYVRNGMRHAKSSLDVIKTSFQYFLNSKFSESNKYLKKEGHTSANWNKADAWHCFEGASGWDVLSDIWKETSNF